MTLGNRMPTTTERENNRRRERRRRAMAAKIYAGLRSYGNYKLPKHCDNNEVLKALCEEAGWTVESDGTTYRKGCKPVEQMDAVGYSVSPSPCSSYQPSRCVSYNPSPTASSFPSPARSPYPMNDYNACDANNEDPLLPWLKNNGSISAPVTPPLNSPGCLSPRRIKANRELGLSFLQTSTPASPMQQVFPHDSSWLAGIYIPNGSSSPTSPTFSLVSRNPFTPFTSSGAWTPTPGQSGTCSPATMGRLEHLNVCDDFEFGSCGNSDVGLVKAWEGERIHEDCAPDELELTLGPAGTRV